MHLIELHELSSFPVVWRDLVTDFLSFFFATFRPYECVAPILSEALKRLRTSCIVDLCSGAGRTVLSVLPALRELGCDLTSVTLTDKFPNRPALSAAAAQGAGIVSWVEYPVDATSVPEHLTGFRTLFTSFHHFEPDQAREVLADAERRAEGIGIFEYTERNLLLWTLPVLLIPFLVWACTPLMRPMTWRRVVWTYLLPVVPLVAMWDGLVSNLRSYSTHELNQLVASLDSGRYRWRIGRARSLGLSRVTYAVGWMDQSPA